MKQINLLLAFALIISLSACKKDKTNDSNPSVNNGESTVFVVNEGNFTQGNASLSYGDEDFANVANDAYQNANNTALGDQAQSIGFNNGKAYIIVTGSNKIEVTNDNTMERVATIASGLTNPRYFESVDSHTALVSCWGDTSDDTDDYLAIIDTNNDTVTGQVPVDLGPEKMVKNDDYLFIAHQGAWGTNNKISVYDLVLKQITNVITVGDRPNSMVIYDNYLWVLCGGEPDWTGAETAGQLYKININNNFNIEETINFAVTEHPSFLTLSGDNLYYYLDNQVYAKTTSDAAIAPTVIITYNGQAYNMEANNGKLYITDALDYQQEGTVSVYDLSDAHLINQKTVGIIPGDLAFHISSSAQ